MSGNLERRIIAKQEINFRLVGRMGNIGIGGDLEVPETSSRFRPDESHHFHLGFTKTKIVNNLGKQH